MLFEFVRSFICCIRFLVHFIQVYSFIYVFHSLIHLFRSGLLVHLFVLFIYSFITCGFIRLSTDLFYIYLFIYLFMYPCADGIIAGDGQDGGEEFGCEKSYFSTVTTT